MAPCPQLNNTNVVFGKVIKGMGIIKELNEIPSDNDVPTEKIQIIDCGELMHSDDWGLEDNDGEDVYTPYPEDWNPSTLHELSYQKNLEIVQKIKSVGNACYSKKKYTTAEKKYKKALRYYEWMMKLKETPQADTVIADLKTVLLLNLAAVKIRQAKYKEALSLCNKVLSVNINNSKALFRRGQAYAGLNEYELGLADLKRAIEENPTNKDILKEIDRVNSVKKSYLEFEKATFQRMFKMN